MLKFTRRETLGACVATLGSTALPGSRPFAAHSVHDPEEINQVRIVPSRLAERMDAAERSSRLDNLSGQTGHELKCRLRLVWTPIGALAVDAAGKITFPQVPAAPGLYLFTTVTVQGARAIYIGESENLEKRFAGYRNAGPTQATNLRISALFRAIISGGGTISLDVVTEYAWIELSDIEVKADLMDKHVRRLFENLALCAQKGVNVESLNR